jgi:hypothetical protein
MNEITKVTIKGESGYGPADEAYKDRVTVEANMISYEYIPVFVAETNPMRKWFYKTTSPIYQKLFNDLVEVMPSIINRDLNEFCTDIGAIEFTVSYADKTKWKETFFLPGDCFKDCFAIIKQMVPDCEYVPAVLLTKEDYDKHE